MIIPVNDPRDCIRPWADRFNARDVEGMLVLAETESVFVDMSDSTAYLTRREERTVGSSLLTTLFGTS
jgi:hypothetical protein